MTECIPFICIVWNHPITVLKLTAGAGAPTRPAVPKAANPDKARAANATPTPTYGTAVILTDLPFVTPAAIQPSC